MNLAQIILTFLAKLQFLVFFSITGIQQKNLENKVCYVDALASEFGMRNGEAVDRINRLMEMEQAWCLKF